MLVLLLWRASQTVTGNCSLNPSPVYWRSYCTQPGQNKNKSKVEYLLRENQNKSVIDSESVATHPVGMSLILKVRQQKQNTSEQTHALIVIIFSNLWINTHSNEVIISRLKMEIWALRNWIWEAADLCADLQQKRLTLTLIFQNNLCGELC